MDLTLDQPVHRLDPYSPGLHQDAELMREYGKVVPVELPGGVPTWVVTHDATARELVQDIDTFRKELSYWGALQRGEVPSDWPLMGIVDTGRNMVTLDGPDHTRLRAPVAKAFTERRIRDLEPTVQTIVDDLLDGLAAAADATEDRVVDFRGLVAWPLPITLIVLLTGLSDDHRPRLRELFDVWFDDTQDSTEAVEELQGMLGAAIEEKSREPGDDIISALLDLPEEEQLTRAELIDTVLVLAAAGHDTTVHLLNNAIRNITRHPEQLRLLLDGDVPWSRLVEETMRYDPPTAHLPFRFATRDANVGGATIRQGEPVMISYIAMGRDSDRYGPTVDDFDIQRPPRGHTSFGHGPHVCIGRPLARLEGRILLERFFTRWPGATVVGDAPRFPSVLMNARTRLNLQLPSG